MRILVVDDNEHACEVLSEILQSFGFETIMAHSGTEAIKILDSETLKKEKNFVKVVFTDWNMPEMNGYEFVCAVRKDDQYKDMRLMMVTTETEMSQVVKALEAGADEYVMKPFTKEMIVEKLTIMGLSVE